MSIVDADNLFFRIDFKREVDGLKKQPAIQKNIAPVEYHFMTVKQQFVQQFLAQYEHEAAFEQVKKWLSPTLFREMEQKLDEQTARRLIEDSYFFLSDAAPDWPQFIMERMKREPQTKLKKLIHTWQQPLFFFGEIIEVTERYVAIKHAWTKELVYVFDFSAAVHHVGENTLLLLVKGLGENIYYSLSMGIILTKASDSLLVAWKKLYDVSELSYSMFFKYHIADFWRLFVSEASLMNGMSAQIKQLLVILDAALIELDLKSEPLFLFTHYYVTHNNITARKKGGFIAAVLQFGMKFNFIPRILTVHQVAQLCSVSTTTVYYYAAQLEKYYKEEFSAWHLLEDEQTLYCAGTDATVVEREKWQLTKVCDERGITDEVTRKRLQRTQDIEFVPKTATDLAQHFAYLAYEQTHDQQRLECAQTAFIYDEQCIDALLLLSDYEDNEVYLQHALALTKKTTETMRNRTYFKTAACAFDKRNFEAAFDYLNSMTTWTVQQQYLRLAVLSALGEVAASQNLLATLPDNALTRWFRWAYNPSAENYSVAITMNAFVDKYRQRDIDPLAYPRHCFYTEGCPIQGRLIYLLLYPMLQNNKEQLQVSH